MTAMAHGEATAMAVSDRAATGAAPALRSGSFPWLSRYGDTARPVLLILFTFAVTRNFCHWRRSTQPDAGVDDRHRAIGMTCHRVGRIDLFGRIADGNRGGLPRSSFSTESSLPEQSISASRPAFARSCSPALFVFFNGWLITATSPAIVATPSTFMSAGRGCPSFTDSTR